MLLTDIQRKDQEEECFFAAGTYIMFRLECHEKGVKGEFHHLHLEEWEAFHSISEFIYKLELMLEEINIPQATTYCRKEWRSMGSNLKKCNSVIKERKAKNQISLLKKPSLDSVHKPGETFFIYIRYRYNSTWQGNIRWMKEKKTMDFRSVLELLMLLENTVIQQRIL